MTTNVIMAAATGTDPRAVEIIGGGGECRIKLPNEVDRDFTVYGRKKNKMDASVWDLQLV